MTSQNNAHFDFITEIKFEEDKKSIPFRCWSEESTIYVKLNLEGGGKLSARMNLDYANIFIQEAIPFIMKKNSKIIKEYLKSN